MSPVLTRRSLVRAGATALGAAAAGIPASAQAETMIPASDPDATWPVLLDRRSEALAVLEAADELLAEATRRALATCPERPAAFRPVFNDIPSGIALVRPDQRARTQARRPHAGLLHGGRRRGPARRGSDHVSGLG